MSKEKYNLICFSRSEINENNKTNKKALEEKAKREKAYAECSKCPCCGETMYFDEAIKKGHGLDKGISIYTYMKSVKTGLFKKDFMSVVKARCNTCGTEWESDPY